MLMRSFSFKSWITRHWTTVLIVFVLIVSFAYRYSMQQKKAKEDLLFKDTVYGKWFKDPMNSEHFEELTKLLDRNRDMHKNYDAPIAQKLMEIGEINKARSFSKVPLKRLKEDFPLYAIFVENSILIAEKKYSDALEKSYAIQDKIKDKECLLNIYNLLRIALLEKTLQHAEKEFAVLNELKSILDKLQGNSISEQEDLIHYLTKRIEVLKQ